MERYLQQTKAASSPCNPLPTQRKSNKNRSSPRVVRVLGKSFHEVFVANPNKTQPVLDILLKNQTKLVEFLCHFQTDRSEDEQFCDEKNYLIKQISNLKRPTLEEACAGGEK